MSLIKVEISDFKLDKAIPYDLVGINKVLLVPKGTILKVDLLDRLSSQDIYIEYADFANRDSDSDEILNIANNKLSNIPLGKDVDAFYVFVREGLTGFKLLPCQYIGWVKDVSIVVEMPRYGNVNTSKIYHMEPGQKVQGKIQCGKIEYIFNSFVICVSNNPVPHFHIKHPSQVKSYTYRKSYRKEIMIDAKINFLDQEFKIVIINLSDSGCAFISDFTLEKDEFVLLDFTIPCIDGTFNNFKLNFTVKNIVKEGRRFRYGGEFTDMNKEHKLLLRSYLYSI